MEFRLPAAGGSGGPVLAHLGYRAPFLVRAGQIIEVLLWGAAAAAGFLVWRGRRRGRRPDLEPEQPDPAWFTPLAGPTPRRVPAAAAGHSRRRRSARPPRLEVVAPADPSEGGERWTDV